MWLPWDVALVIAILLTSVGFVWRPSAPRWLVAAPAFAREAALVFALYALWQRAGQISVMRVDGALDRGRWLWEVEQALGLPNELSIQRFVSSPLLAQAANMYYATAHVAGMVLLLVWLFALHRDAYPRWRTTIALTTFACLVVQLVPVAPPRMFPELGFVDTALVYGQSVYGRFDAAGPAQLSAMPSLHVGWALIVGLAAIVVSSSRWRWLVLAHPVLTVLVVVATANHWWADGIVAGVILAVALVAVIYLPRPLRAIRGSSRPAEIPALSGLASQPTLSTTPSGHGAHPPVAGLGSSTAQAEASAQ